MLRTILVLLLASWTIFAADPVSKVYNDQLDIVESHVLSLARAMPADKYDFVPSGPGFVDVRTFGEQVRHVATMIYMTAAIVLEERSPYGPGKGDNGPDNVRTKEECLRYLQDSLAYARTAANSLTEQNQMEPIKSAFGPMPRSAVAAGFAYHSFDHYGQMVIYARMNGIVPPASVPPAR